MSSYVENFRGKVDFPKPFQRTGKFPLDRTELFSSYEDAVKYAAGNREDPDSRGLCGTSYIGQVITVYENDVVSRYQINADRTLKSLESKSSFGTASGSIEPGFVSSSITLPANSRSLSVEILDRVTGEQIFTDVSHSGTVVTVSLAEAYANPLDIVVFYRV